jgi:hypothetical protein
LSRSGGAEMIELHVWMFTWVAFVVAMLIWFGADDWGGMA